MEKAPGAFMGTVQDPQGSTGLLSAVVPPQARCLPRVPQCLQSLQASCVGLQTASYSAQQRAGSVRHLVVMAAWGWGVQGGLAAGGGGQTDAPSLRSGRSRAAGNGSCCTRRDSRAARKLHVVIFHLEKAVSDREHG